MALPVYGVKNICCRHEFSLLLRRRLHRKQTNFRPKPNRQNETKVFSSSVLHHIHCLDLTTKSLRLIRNNNSCFPNPACLITFSSLFQTSSLIVIRTPSVSLHPLPIPTSSSLNKQIAKLLLHSSSV